MTRPFDQLHMPKELACEFLAVFSRFEYALKSTGYVKGNGDWLRVAWKQFGRDVDERFRTDMTKEVIDAVGFLTDQPPRKQVFSKGLRFKDCPPDAQQPKAVQVLLMVGRVRNNLFHGGKYLSEGETEAGRNEHLVRCSVIVLEYCLRLDLNVQASYER